jgi:hypothetical protein
LCFGLLAGKLVGDGFQFGGAIQLSLGNLKPELPEVWSGFSHLFPQDGVFQGALSGGFGGFNHGVCHGVSFVFVLSEGRRRRGGALSKALGRPQ